MLVLFRELLQDLYRYVCLLQADSCQRFLVAADQALDGVVPEIVFRGIAQ